MIRKAANGYLLDTHTALWAMDRPEALSLSARQAILDGPNFLSVISFWEVTIKSMKGTLRLGDPRIWWTNAIDKLAADTLSLRSDHISALNTLPPIHKDPFDRTLIAQSISERFILVSADARIAKYVSAGLQLIA